MDNLHDTIFYKIINGELPSYKIYEDEDFLVILDRFPANPGHCLILPKTPAKDIFGLDEKTAARLYPLAQKIAQGVKAATGCDGINILQNNGSEAGQVIFYFHVHIIPRYKNDRVNISPRPNDFELEHFENMTEKLRRGLEL